MTASAAARDSTVAGTCDGGHLLRDQHVSASMIAARVDAVPASASSARAGAIQRSAAESGAGQSEPVQVWLTDEGRGSMNDVELTPKELEVVVCDDDGTRRRSARACNADGVAADAQAAVRARWEPVHGAGLPVETAPRAASRGSSRRWWWQRGSEPDHAVRRSSSAPRRSIACQRAGAGSVDVRACVAPRGARCRSERVHACARAGSRECEVDPRVGRPQCPRVEDTRQCIARLERAPSEDMTTGSARACTKRFARGINVLPPRDRADALQHRQCRTTARWLSCRAGTTARGRASCRPSAASRAAARASPARLAASAACSARTG